MKRLLKTLWLLLTTRKRYKVWVEEIKEDYDMEQYERTGER